MKNNEQTITPDKLKKYWIPLYEDIYRRVDNRMRSTPIPPPPRRTGKNTLLQFKNTLLAKLGTAYTVLDSNMEKIVKALEAVDKMHDFYKELFIIKTGRSPADLLGRYRAKRRILNRIYRDTRTGIKSSLTGGEAKRAFRGGLGRMLSLLKRDRALLEAVKEAIKEISGMPDVTGDLVVIIAGMPQVGKSTLLKKLTRAEPEISPYPFTTKTIIAGHIEVKPYGKITLIDTPGLLDRPVDKRNEIEMKAVLALKHLSDILLYLFDTNPNTYYSLDEQLAVYRDVINTIGSDDIIVAINKIDITPEDILEESRKKIANTTGREPLLISADKGYGLGKLLEILENKLIEKIRSHLS